jgi:hypothetical protein
MSLRARLNDLASSFTASVLDAIRGASLEELLTESSEGTDGPRRASRASGGRTAAVVAAAAPRRRGGRLPRRSATDIGNAIDQIVELLNQHPDGLRAEQIRQELNIEAKELPRPLKEGLYAGRLSKMGQKRATTYFAASAGASAPRRSRSK